MFLSVTWPLIGLLWTSFWLRWITEYITSPPVIAFLKLGLVENSGATDTESWAVGKMSPRSVDGRARLVAGLCSSRKSSSTKFGTLD